MPRHRRWDLLPLEPIKDRVFFLLRPIARLCTRPAPDSLRRMVDREAQDSSDARLPA
uniref:Uncharacterized protein n=1 Tax=Arundo donax TaxID=35708 RepID=A0A0A8XTN6_ARUDO